MIVKLVATLLLLSGSLLASDPDVERSFKQLVESRGFELKEYEVETADGYINVVHRVVPPNFDPATYSRTRKPLILNHGIMFQSNVFFYNSPFLTANDSQTGDNFGFGAVLSGKYDVWAPNARGNGISEKHKKYSTWNPLYWDFSWEEIGTQDLPAVISLIQRETGHKTVAYVGHSQGATIVPAAISLKPELAQSIRPFVAWAPSAFIGNTELLSPLLLAILNPVMHAAPGKFVLTDEWLNMLLQASCPGPIGTPVCKAVIEIAFGKTSSLNEARIPVYMHFSPNPCSNKQMAHFIQLAVEKKFNRYNYGLLGNLINYGRTSPPDYDLSRIPANFPTFVAYGNTDGMVVPKDAETFISTLRSKGVPVTKYKVPTPTWNHYDYAVGTGAGRLVFDKTIEYLDQNIVQDGPQ